MAHSSHRKGAHSRGAAGFLTQNTSFLVIIAIVAAAVGFYYWQSWNPRAQEQTITPPTELLTNGSFETDADGDKIPDGWTWQGDRVFHQEGIICKDAYEGACAFVLDGRRTPRSLRQTMQTTGAAGDTITFRVASKSHKVQAPYQANLTVTYEGGVTNTHSTMFTPAENSESYQVATITFKTTAAYSKFEILLPFYQQRGDIAFDGVSLTVSH